MDGDGFILPPKNISPQVSPCVQGHRKNKYSTDDKLFFYHRAIPNLITPSKRRLTESIGSGATMPAERQTD